MTHEAGRELASLGELADVARELGADERRVLLVLARRLLEGQRCYGRLNVATDARDFRQERALEVQDLLIYSAFAELQALNRLAT